MEVAWILPGTWDIWSVAFAGCLAADNSDNSSHHGIHDSIGNMPWSS